MKKFDIGTVHLPEQALMLKKVGEVNGPNGRYEIFVDGRNQPVVRSLNTQKKFILTWENICELATMNGVDDAGGPWVPRHLNMTLQTGNFSTGD